MTGTLLGSLAVALAGLAALPATAVEVSLSGFGTVGYARSTESFTYDRFIRNTGTFRRDSVFGLQMDTRLTNDFGATVQVKASPASDDDDRYVGVIAWAFLSYRPTNDWLIRVGRQRMPLYLHSANFDVGVTYEFARLPTEMYSISPNNEIDGLSFSKNWTIDEREINLDGFWGKTNADVRIWARDTIPNIQNAGPMFRRLTVQGGGIGLSYKKNDDSYRVAYGSVLVNRRDRNPIPATFPFVTLYPGVGYYQVDNSLPGPGVPGVERIRISTIILGADLGLGSDYRIISELAHSTVPQTDLSIQSVRGYVSLLKQMDSWTPYFTVAFLRSQSRPLDLYKNVNRNTVPSLVPGSNQINASQRAGADQVLAFDQRSFSLGTSYSLSPTSKIKAEWMRVRIGEVSSLVDAPPGSNIRNQNINVFSLSYSMVF